MFKNNGTVRTGARRKDPGGRSDDGQVCTWENGAVSTSRGRDGTGWGEDDSAGCCLRHFASVDAEVCRARQTVES